MSYSESLRERLSKRASRLRRSADLYEEAAEHIDFLESQLDKVSKREAEMHSALEKIAALSHHGGLIGFEYVHKCLAEVRQMSMPWWDANECSRLQRKKKR